MAEFEVPKMKEFVVTPVPLDDVMKWKGPFVAKPNHQEALGFPGELVDNWKEEALNSMQDMLGKYRSFQVFMDACVKCGACTDKCHYFLGTGDAKNMPVARQDLIRKVYRRYFTLPVSTFLNWWVLLI